MKRKDISSEIFSTEALTRRELTSSFHFFKRDINAIVLILKHLSHVTVLQFNFPTKMQPTSQHFNIENKTDMSHLDILFPPAFNLSLSIN